MLLKVNKSKNSNNFLSSSFVHPILYVAFDMEYGGSKYQKSFLSLLLICIFIKSLKSRLKNSIFLLLREIEKSTRCCFLVSFNICLPGGILNSPFELNLIWLLKP